MLNRKESTKRSFRDLYTANCMCSKMASTYTKQRPNHRSGSAVFVVCEAKNAWPKLQPVWERKRWSPCTIFAFHHFKVTRYCFDRSRFLLSSLLIFLRAHFRWCFCFRLCCHCIRFGVVFVSIHSCCGFGTDEMCLFDIIMILISQPIYTIVANTFHSSSALRKQKLTNKSKQKCTHTKTARRKRNGTNHLHLDGIVRANFFFRACLDR